MPILGLFPTSQEERYARDVGGFASGKRSSLAVQDIQQNADTARKEAFTQAYQSRGNPALARRQAMDVSRDVTMQSGQQMARQRAEDVNAAKAEQQRLEQQRVAGINNAIGFAAQSSGLLHASPAEAASPIQNAVRGLFGLNKTQQPNNAPSGGSSQAMQQSGYGLSRPSLDETFNQWATDDAFARITPQTTAPRGIGAYLTQEDRNELLGPSAASRPAAPMRQDLQQYMDPNVGLESGSRLSNDVSGLQNVGSQLTPEYLLQGLPLNPQFLRGVRRNARR